MKGLMRLICLAFLVMAILASGCGRASNPPSDEDLQNIKPWSLEKQTKKVILVLVDSMMAKTIDRGIKEKKLPAFQFLIQHGQYHKKVVSSFPTMSVTIDSSLFTGTYPDQHKVPGLVWYASGSKRIVNYGTGLAEILNQNPLRVLDDAALHLNMTHLSKDVTTIYEDLAEKHLTSGSINGMIFRGKTKHRLEVPLWLSAVTPLRDGTTVQGPDFLGLGILSNPLRDVKDLPDGVTENLGFNDAFSLEMAKYLIETKQLPNFLYIYFPDLDKASHEKPGDLEALEKVDRKLGALLDSFGSWDKALDEAIFLVLGDSGVNPILPDEENPVISLPRLLGKYRVAQAGRELTPADEVVLAVNDRMAYVYALKKSPSVRDLAHTLAKDPRIGLLAWKEEKWIHVIQGGTGSRMRYRLGGDVLDPYKQRWTLEGDTDVMGVKINQKQRTIDYTVYPDGLRRLYGALYSHKGEFLVASAELGYQFTNDISPSHIRGGGHGSLHQEDSLVPLIIAGTKKAPAQMRIVDLKSYILDLLVR